MKRYESVTRISLTRRTPVIIRLDGKAFHSFTRNCERPYDTPLHEAMLATASGLVCEIQGAVFAYVQSDEISILIRDWDTITTEAWFDYNLQKLVSVSASIATARFNKHYASKEWALFDSRAFNIPASDVVNYFIWRQQDATRNSINMLGQSEFSPKQLHGKSTSAVQDMLMSLDPPINWNDVTTWAKRGCCITTEQVVIDENPRRVVRMDEDIPIFTQNNEYITRYLTVDEPRKAQI